MQKLVWSVVDFLTEIVKLEELRCHLTKLILAGREHRQCDANTLTLTFEYGWDSKPWKLERIPFGYFGKFPGDCPSHLKSSTTDVYAFETTLWADYLTKIPKRYHLENSLARVEHFRRVENVIT